jgi:hypothetical protein
VSLFAFKKKVRGEARRALQKNWMVWPFVRRASICVSSDHHVGRLQWDEAHTYMPLCGLTFFIQAVVVYEAAVA